MKRTLPLIALLCLAASCTSDSLSDLSEKIDSSNISYAQNIRPIMQNNCLSCHGAVPSNGAQASLATYEGVRQAILNENMISKISRAEGTPGAMPLGGPRLPQPQIDLIVQWSQTGFNQ
ncbi:MAG TPA: cytochrome c [Flavobacterium sp.]|nr:cytochrome c [Flavobacterium sp.]